MPRPDNVNVGTACFISSDGGKNLLLGLRKGAHEAGLWACPGGWLDPGELNSSIAVAREIKEETGLIICPERIKPLKWSIEIHEDLKATCVTLYHGVDISLAETAYLQLKEPNKCEQWAFFPINELPENLFPGLQITLNKCMIEKNER
jgi:8-oxo-dGTP diphosphatase